MNNKTGKKTKKKGVPFVICEKLDDAPPKDISALWPGRIGAKAANQRQITVKLKTVMDFASQICSLFV